MPSLTTGNGIAAATPPRAWSYHDLLRAELARPAQLVDPFIAAGTAGFLAGPPNVGKSWLLYAIALAVATGTPWLGRFPARPGRVLVVDEESTDYYIRERLLMLAAGLGLADDDLPIRFLVNHGLRVDDARGFAALDAEMSAHRPDLVLADSLIRLHGAEENSSGQMADVFASVKRLMVAHGPAFLFTDHARKKSMISNDPEELQRGSSEKRAFADSVLFVAPAERGTMTLAHTKARYGERLPDFRVDLRIGDGTATLAYAGEVAAGPGGAKLSEIVAAIQQVKEQLGPDASDITLIAGQAECSVPTAKKYLDLLVKAGHVTVRQVKGAAGRPRNVFDVPEQR